MKKVSCLILSFILLLSVGSVNVLAMEDTGEVSLYEESKENVEEDALQQDAENGELDEVDSIEDRPESFENEKDESPSETSEEDEDENTEEIEKPEEDSEEIEFLTNDQGDSDETEWTEITLPELKYDDRYSLGDLTEISKADGEYVISEIITNESNSCQVASGVATRIKDEVVTQASEDSLDIIATGVGTATIYLVPAGREETDEKTDDADTSEADEIPEAGFQVNVTVIPATLTLMYLTGQSNMEGLCSDNSGDPNSSIACQEGTVYSTYAPTNSNSDKITGLTFSSYCDVDNAEDFVAGSLQSDTSISGESLIYKLNSLTTEGSGKAGPDSGLAYEWNDITGGDKVWVINTAWSGTNIASWVPGADLYKRSEAVWEYVNQVYEAELSAGHYTAGKKLGFWLQGETGDKTKEAADYLSDFTTLSSTMKKELGLNALGIIMVRASTGSYTTDDEWEMTGPRIAQYVAGGSAGLSNVYVVSNVNEQWVTNSGVKSYFQTAYPGGSLSYPMHSGSTSLPTTVNAVHSDIHYSQIGHNENGITAAYGMYQVLQGSAVPTDVEWRNEDGKAVTSLDGMAISSENVLIPVTNPVYAAKSVSYSVSGNAVSYNSSIGIVTAKALGNSTITALYNGNSLSKVSITIGEGVVHYDDGWWYVKDGKIDTSYTGFAQNENGWWYIENGKVTFNKNSVIQDTNKKIDGTSSWWYVVGSKVQTDFTGLADYSNSNGWWYINNGKVTFDVETVAQNKNGWYYVEGSKVDFNYNGFAHNSNGWWYIESGKVTFNKNSVIQDTHKKINGKSDWWYVVGSKVQTSFTGLADYSNSNGWWYINDGKVTFDVETVAQNKNGWYYVEDSKVIFSYNGFAKNSNGWWYIESGKVTFNKNSVIQDKNKKIDGKTSWWYVVGSKVQTSFTGLADYSNSNGWWYINNGKVTFDQNTVAKNKNGWYYVEDSKVIFSYNGFAKNSNGWWYLENGKVTFNKNSVIQDKNKKIDGKSDWWYVVGSKVQTSFTGLADYKNSNGWWYINNGKVTFDQNTVAKNKNGWYYVLGSKVQFGFTGLADYPNSNGWWYINNGKVTFNVNTVAKNKNGWWYVKNSKVDFGFNGIASNANGRWYLKGGKVDFTYNGTCNYNGKRYTIVNGKVK